MATISRLTLNKIGKISKQTNLNHVRCISGYGSPAIRKFPDSRQIIRECYDVANDAEELKHWMAANRPTKKFKIEPKSESQWTLEDCHITPTGVRWFGLSLAIAGYVFYIRSKQRLWMRTDLNKDNKDNKETQTQPPAEGEAE